MAGAGTAFCGTFKPDERASILEVVPNLQLIE
jgi:hypothetical protein